MHPALQIMATVPIVIYYILEAIIVSLIPRRFRYKDVSEDTVLITGAASGIGRELALKFADLGATLVLLDINMSGLKETEAMLNKDNRDVFLYECDLSKRRAIYEVAAKIKEEVGMVSILINNAGIVTGKKLLDCPDEMIIKTMEVNALAHFWTCKAFLPDMIAANHGHIVSVASLAGHFGIYKLTDYCASKFAAVGFSEALRTELRCDNLDSIKTTIVCPSFTSTGLFEGSQLSLHEAISPEYVADKIIAGIRMNQEVVTIPSFLGFAPAVKYLLPRKAYLKLAGLAGIATLMDTFTGRVKQD